MTTMVVPPIEMPPGAADARRAVWDRAGRAAALAALAAALFIYVVVVPVLAWRWMQLPFVGALVDRGLVIVGGAGLEWPALEAGARPGERLAAIDGVALGSRAELERHLAARAVGQVVTLGLVGETGQARQVTVTLSRFPVVALGMLFDLPVAVGLLHLGIGLLVFRLRRDEAAGQALALFCALAAVALATSFDELTTQTLGWAWSLAAPMAGAALLALGLVFPQEAGLAQRRPGLRLLPFVPAASLSAYALLRLFDGTGAQGYGQARAWVLAFLVMSAGIFVLGTAYRRMTSPAPVAREQSQMILLGALAAFGLIGLWAAQAALTGQPLALNPALHLPPLALFPAAMAYALLRYRLLDTDYAISQGLVYAGMLAFTLAAYGLIITGASLLLGAAVQASHPAVLAVLVFVMLAVFQPLRARLERLVNEAFFRGTRANAERLEGFGRALTRAVALADIVAALDEQLAGGLRPAHAHLFLRDAQNEEFVALPPELPGKAQPAAFGRTDLRFAAGGALAAHLRRERAALHLSLDTPLPPQLLPDRARLAVLGSAIYAPLHGQAGLAGWLAVGPKLSGQPLTRSELRFVEALADQSALAVERATVISDLERRVRELNVLSQVSQAVNFTMAYDDLLELIYAQASKVVDTRNFTILLRDGRGPGYRFELYVENDERETEQEQRPWTAGRGLNSEVLRSGQPIRTDDYLAECRRRGVGGRANKDTRAWMGVPLNAGAETIGVMSVAAFDPGATFSEDQLKIFWAIADQAASAIVRAQLLRKAEERARQLSTLNELSTTLASNLELDPLLARIVESSMDILGCQAGSLFLTDEDSGEYVFRVAAGPVGQDLVGMRIGAGKGFVGQAIETGTVLIVNDVQNDPRWFQGSDASTGFVTRALMVVPLRRGERTIGALEVINKRDESAFDEEDSGLLTAFAGQATVAIENARLFAQTDEALAGRVAELSMMQRIDRELNAALDVQRVMDITLDWAMKNTRAYAGSVGMVSEAGIHIIATSGYGDTVEQLRDRPLSTERGIMGRVVRTGQMNLVRDVRSDPDYRGVLAATRSQLTIPIVRENSVVGLINLESPRPDAFSEEQVAFVTRMLDHAAVAISNARLYAEVTAANIAKSDFVSVAAHELKTPMTSIKMSSELMLSGAVGGLNDTQRQFLSTIRNNLDRMTTIVSDLNDITRIETGRMRLEPQALDFAAVVDEVLRATRGLVEAKQQALIVELPAGLPLVLADQDRAAQVLTNLVSNANKYTPENGQIVIRAQVAGAVAPGRAGAPDAAGAQDGIGAPEGDAGLGELHVTVRDSGIGISPEDQRRLFTKFFRSDDRTAREMASGTGLGLSIVKNLVELQGGRIWMESELRQGSSFHFTLPLAPAAPQPAPVIDPPSRRVEGAGGS